MRLAPAFLAVFVVVLGSCGSSAKLNRYDPDAWTSKSALLARRDSLRAYDGAPPVIPHAVADLGRKRCESCHAPGSPANGARIGPPRSHPAFQVSCLQCHVEQRDEGEFQSNGLEPLRWTATGSRLYATAPPTIPHHLQNRDNCAICHIGEQAPAALRARHGKRDNCRQCHAASQRL